MDAYLTGGQINKIQFIVENELLKRGFPARMRYFHMETAGSKVRISFLTIDFQTIPVLFRKFYVCDWNSRITPWSGHLNHFINPNKKVDAHEVYFEVVGKYEDFSEKMGCIHLFTYTAIAYKTEIYNHKTY